MGTICSVAQIKGPSVVSTDSLPTHLYDYLVSSNSKHFHDPSIPRFLIKDRSENFVLGIGGYIQATAFYDYGGLTAKGFSVSDLLPNSDMKYRNDNFEIYSNYSTLFLKLIGQTKKGMLNAYIRTSFSGGKGNNRMSQAYVEYLGITIGRALTTFSDSESPTQLDMGGAVSFTDKVIPLVRYTFNVGNHSKFAVAIESTQTSQIIYPELTNSSKYKVVDMTQSLPDLPISYTYDNNRVHLFCSANMRYMDFRREFQEKCQSVFTYAGQFSARVHLFKTSRTCHSLYGHFVYANGMTDCIAITTGLGHNVIFHHDNPEQFSLSQRYGAYVGYQFRFGQNQMNALYSITEPLGKERFNYDLFKKGEYFAVNYVRRFMDHATVGAEFLWGNKTTNLNNGGSDWRLVALVRYDF